MPTRFDQAIEFLNDIKPTDGVAIIYNNDADGICSCTIIKKYLSKKGIEPYIIAQPMPPDKQLVRRVQTGAPNKIVWLDMAVDEAPSFVQRMSGFADQLVVDHHVIMNDLSKIRGVIHYNPRFKEKGVYQSTTYIAWQMAKKLMEEEDVTWISGIGAVADYDLRWSKDLVAELEERWSLDTFQRLADMLEAARVTKTLGFDQIVERLLTTEDPENILKDEKIIRAYNELEADIDAAITDAQASGELVEGVFFYEMRAKYNIKSKISGRLSEKWPERLIFVYEKTRSAVTASVRSHGAKYDLSVILPKAAKGIKGASAGGHEAAGGGTVPVEEWENFKQKLVDEAKKYKAAKK